MLNLHSFCLCGDRFSPCVVLVSCRQQETESVILYVTADGSCDAEHRRRALLIVLLL